MSGLRQACAQLMKTEIAQKGCSYAYLCFVFTENKNYWIYLDHFILRFTNLKLFSVLRSTGKDILGLCACRNSKQAGSK